MRLTSFQKQQVRNIVNLHRNLLDLNRGLSGRRREAQTQLAKRKRLLEEVHEERKSVLLPGRGYGAAERDKVKKDFDARVAACERELADTQAVIDDIDRQAKELQTTLRQTSQLSESLVELIGNADAVFREDMGGLGARQVHGPQQGSGSGPWAGAE